MFAAMGTISYAMVDSNRYNGLHFGSFLDVAITGRLVSPYPFKSTKSAIQFIFISFFSQPIK